MELGSYCHVFQKNIEEMDVDTSDSFDTSCFSGNLRWDDDENSRDCWRLPDGNNFKVRSENFFKDKSKVASSLI